MSVSDTTMPLIAAPRLNAEGKRYRLSRRHLPTRAHARHR